MRKDTKNNKKKIAVITGITITAIVIMVGFIYFYNNRKFQYDNINKYVIYEEDVVIFAGGYASEGERYEVNLKNRTIKKIHSRSVLLDPSKDTENTVYTKKISKEDKKILTEILQYSIANNINQRDIAKNELNNALDKSLEENDNNDYFKIILYKKIYNIAGTQCSIYNNHELVRILTKYN